MRNWLDRVIRFIVEENGPTAVEYAFMLAVIIVLSVAVVASIGNTTVGPFEDTSNSLP